MKGIILALALVFGLVSVNAQGGTWKILLHGKIILSTGVEDENNNVRKLTLKEWKKKGQLEIDFKEPQPEFWKRSFLFFDENDEQLWTIDSVTRARIPLTDLRKAFKNKKQVRIYTVITPLDPNIAVRIRRVHLCTLRLP